VSELHLDVESRSIVDLRKTGAHPYWMHEETHLWCACYCVDDEPIQDWLPGDPTPDAVQQAVFEGWDIYAHNSQFEKLAWQHKLGPRHGWPVPDPEQFHCTAAWAAAMALPRDLGGAAEAMGLPVTKDQAGRRLMLSMAKPRSKPGQPLRWWDLPERIERLVAYCRTDVEVERALTKRLRALSENERKLFLLDAQINDRGVRVDLEKVQQASIIVKKALADLDREIGIRTRNAVTKATQAARLTQWLNEQGVDVESVDKVAVKSALTTVTDPNLRRVLEIRQEAAKSSTAKLEAFQNRACADGRMRENLLFHGAATGRWSGKGAQLQNLPRPSLKQHDIEAAIDAMQSKDPAWLTLWGPPLSVVSDCLRGMIIADPGKELVMADFSAIEGRVLAWLAGEQWKLDAYRAYDRGEGPDLYKLTAAGILGIPVEEVTGEQRQGQGKVPELFLGYGGGKGAFISGAALYGYHVEEERADEIKVAWRAQNPAIVQFWYDLDRAAMSAVRQPGRQFKAGRISYASAGNILWCRLPSGRLLSYVDPKIREVETPWGAMRDSVTYMGVDSVTRKWDRHKAYGGHWAENCCQAVARDVMAEAMLRVEQRGWPVVLTCHDEIISEVPAGTATAEEYEAELCALPDWAEGLPLAAEGCVSRRYRK